MPDKDPLESIKASISSIKDDAKQFAEVPSIKSAGSVRMTSGRDAVNNKFTAMIADATREIYALADRIGMETKSPGVVLSALVSAAYNVAKDQKMLEMFKVMMADTAVMIKDEKDHR